MLNKEIPFLRIGLPLCAGIVSGHHIKPDPVVLAICAIISVAGFAAGLFFNRSLVNRVYGYALTLSLFIVGLLLYSNEKSRLSELRSVPADIRCVVSEFPEKKENSIRVTVRLKSSISQARERALHGSMLLYIGKDYSEQELLPGDIIRIRCTPRPIVNRGNPDEFDYRFYMENHGIRYSAYVRAEDISDHFEPKHRKLVYKALIIRENIIGMYKKRNITGDTLALVAALTLGQKSMLDPEQKQNFIKAGVMHVMAVSGLHTVILSLFIFNLLFFMKKRFNMLRVIITVLLLWAFAFVTGLTPSVLRATLMFTFLQAGTLMKRNVNNINSVLASAFVLILIRPSVLFDAGFLLSYSAVIFIICFYNELYNKLDFKNWIADKIWQSTAITIIAQAGTLSLTISLFNRFPTWFILTNLIIVPLSSFLIIIGCLVLLTYPVGFISQLLASILGYLTGITETLTEKSASLPLSTIENIGMKPVESALLFIFIFLSTLFLLNRKSIPVRYPLTALLLFSLSVTIKDITNRTTGELIVFNTYGANVVGVRTGKILNVYADTTVQRPEVLRYSGTQALKLKMNAGNEPVKKIRNGNNNILICSYLNNNILKNTSPDLIILTGNNPEVERKITVSKPVRFVIITSGFPANSILAERLNKCLTDSVHYIKKTGAFRLRL